MTIGIIGGGAWGTALAQVMASDGTAVRLWAREAETAEAINSSRENPVFLPGIKLAASIRADTDIATLSGADLLFAVTPAQHLRTMLASLPPGNSPLILCCKGIEAATGLLTGEVASAVCPDAPLAVLSGPTFAHEVARGLPTAITLAANDEVLAARLARRIARPHFRPYVSSDFVGAEIGGAVKNVLAIACGVVAGRGLGENARAALIARGFAEMTRFGLAKGARAETLGGLSGMGDLVLTCSSTASRNFSLGKGLGEGRSPAELMANRTTVAEGAHTAPVLQKVARAMGVDMPVTDAVCALIAGEMPVDEAVSALLSRPLKRET